MSIRNSGTSLLHGWSSSALQRAAASAIALAAGTLLVLPPGARAQSDGMVLNATSDYRDMAVAHAKEGSGSRQAPPRGGRFVYGHWTPYQAPAPDSYAPNSTTHAIGKGESLWGIAGSYYGDSLLWPYLWESNSWILDPDWIYPGDVLLIPPLMTLPDGSLDVAGGGMPGILDEYVTTGNYADYYCGMFIADPNTQFAGEIVGMEDDPSPVMATLHDLVFLNVGARDGVLPGDEFAVIYPRQHLDTSVEAREKWWKQLHHPMTGKKLGYPMNMAGRLKIVLLGEELSTAQVTYACDAIEVGYDIHPFMEVPQPLRKRDQGPWREPVNAMPDKGRGFIAYVADEMLAGHQGRLVTIDLGSDEGVLPGDTFTVFRDTARDFDHQDVEYFGDFWDFREGAKRMPERRDHTEYGTWGNQRPVYDLPPRVFGKLVVLYTERHTATAKITVGRSEMLAGDSIVYDPIGSGLSQVGRIEAAGMEPNVPIGFQSGGPDAAMETFAPLGQ
jgi:hypothetical protein